MTPNTSGCFCGRVVAIPPDWSMCWGFSPSTGLRDIPHFLRNQLDLGPNVYMYNAWIYRPITLKKIQNFSAMYCFAIIFLTNVSKSHKIGITCQINFTIKIVQCLLYIFQETSLWFADWREMQCLTYSLGHLQNLSLHWTKGSVATRENMLRKRGTVGTPPRSID